MTRLLFILFLLLTSSHLFAQPNFTYNDMPTIGDADSLWQIPVYTPMGDLDQETGLNYQWDFTDLQLNDLFWAVDSFRVRTHPVSEPFEDATIEWFHQEASGNNLELYSFDSDTLFTHRTGSTVGGTAFTPPIASIKFPIAFEQSSDIFSPLLFGTTAIGERRTTTTYDGFGSIDLPNGQSFDNVFRVKSVVRDSTYITTFSTVYTNYLWYQQGGDVPLLRMQKIEFNGLSLDVYSLYTRKLTGTSTTVHEHIEQDLYVYPIPTSEELNFSKELSQKSYEIYDLSGMLIRQGQLNRNKTLDVKDLSNGVYVLKLNGGTTRRFVKG